jgi:RNA polymerase sigma factor (TIGR02999 family)
MSEVTRILSAIDRGDPSAAEHLLPLVYDELRKLAAARIAEEKPGQTLQATALVHEAYVRLVGDGRARAWDGRGHFFAAAAEAMRRILVERARHKATLKCGGERERQAFDPDRVPANVPGDPLEVLAVHEALDLLAAESPRKAELVKLRYFLGCTMAALSAFSWGSATRYVGDERTRARHVHSPARAPGQQPVTRQPSRHGRARPTSRPGAGTASTRAAGRTRTCPAPR